MPAAVEDQRDPLWYKDAVIYQVHVRAFYDSCGDGVGDFRGLAEKLDYLHDLGVTAIWLLPFYPSPLKDDGYDIADYTSVNPLYGSLRDFKTFLREAHRRDLRVITELVINHTSDQHEWFRKSRRAKPGTKWRGFYMWSEDPHKYSDARIIFKDFETSNWAWDPEAEAYYWHRFYSHQPDLNYDSPHVREAVLKVIDFWMELGVDGFRLDAVPYLFAREGTTCENLPETHAFLKELRQHVDRKFPNRMLLAEANQWPEDAAAYFGNGDECHMNFHFPLMPRLFMALQREDRFPVVDILQQTPAIPETCQWTIFLRNHDELTLEMVTDEERDYMYRVYADEPRARINLGIRRRLASLLGNNRRRIELMNGLLFSLPGTPVIYYGDEIGMGDNIYLGDRDSVRTPMQWSADRNAGFSRANPQKLFLPVVTDPEFHFQANNVETQENNPQSMLWWMKRLIALRKRFHVFGRGSLEFLFPENPKVLAFLRKYEDEIVLVVANLSRFAQYLELDLSEYSGMVPVELFGQTNFPPIGELPYLLTLGPHSFCYFALQPQQCEIPVRSPAQLPTCRVRGSWEKALSGRAKSTLESAFPAFLKQHTWFLGNGLRIQSAKLQDLTTIDVLPEVSGFQLTTLHVEYVEREPETYLLPLACATEAHLEVIAQESPAEAVAWVQCRRRAGRDTGRRAAREEPFEEYKCLLYDATFERYTCMSWLAAIARRRRFKCSRGEVVAAPTRLFRRIQPPGEELPEPTIRSGEQGHTLVIYRDRFLLRMFRRLEEGLNPELEISRFLCEQTAFPQVLQLAGTLEYHRDGGAPTTLGVLYGYVANEGTVWRYALDELGRFFERITARLIGGEPDVEVPRIPALRELMGAEQSYELREMLGPFLESSELIGRRTAELHLALASSDEDANFAPEPFSSFYQRGLYQSMRSLARMTLQQLRRKLQNLPESVQRKAEEVLSAEDEILERFQSLRQRKLSALRIRCHGNYHLDNLLYTGKDVVVTNFQGPAHVAVSERRIKRSPLRDVAAMIRSLHYAAFGALLGQVPGIGGPLEDLPALGSWADMWASWNSAVFLKAYLQTAQSAEMLPASDEELKLLLEAYLLEKAFGELGEELQERPEWVSIPLEGIIQCLERGV